MRWLMHACQDSREGAQRRQDRPQGFRRQRRQPCRPIPLKSRDHLCVQGRPLNGQQRGGKFARIRSKARRDKSTNRARSVQSRSIAFANAVLDRGSTATPVSPTTSTDPVPLPTITVRPAASASQQVIEKFSATLGCTQKLH